MSLPMFEQAVLTADLPEHGLRAGDVGVVVDRHESPESGVGYSVEFFDLAGNTVAVAVVPESHLRPPTHDDLPTVRRRVA